jgi:hypothetical protein
MSHQRGIPNGALYHRQLAAMLKNDPGVRLRLSIARDFTLDPASRLDRLMAETAIDGVLFHVRELKLLQAARAFTREPVSRSHHLNPAVLHRRHDSGRWVHRAEEAGADAYGTVRSESDWTGISPDHDRSQSEASTAGVVAVEESVAGRRFVGFLVSDVNFLAGTIVGLGDWSIERQIRGLDALERSCRERGVPLFVLGPIPPTFSRFANRLVRTANCRLRCRLAGSDVGLALIERTRDDAGHPLTGLDGFHRTVEGHRFIAEQLYEQGMREWVGCIVGGKTDLREAEPQSS